MLVSGNYGMLADGRQVQCDMQTAQAIKMCYIALSDVLSSAQMVVHFEDHFLRTVGSEMTGTHSFASSAMSHICHSTWMMPGEAVVSLVGSAGGQSGTPDSNKSHEPSKGDKGKAEDSSKLAKQLANLSRSSSRNRVRHGNAIRIGCATQTAAVTTRVAMAAVAAVANAWSVSAMTTIATATLLSGGGERSSRN